MIRCVAILLMAAGGSWSKSAQFGPSESGASSPESRYEYTQVHMGLPVRLVLYAASDAAALQAARAAFARIAALDHMMSDYQPDSEVRRIADHAGTAVAVSPELFTVLRRAREIARATDGAFDPTVAPVVALWREARRTGRAPTAEALASAKRRVGWRGLELDEARTTVRLATPGMALDLGGIAKGYILQEALRELRAHDVTRVLIESGGDIVIGEAPPGRIGWRIETPGADATFAARASRLVNAALATSGADAQHVDIDGVRYSHIVDPRTGLGATTERVARVIAKDAATADALATALTVLDESGAKAALDRFPDVVAGIVQRAEAARR